MNILLIGDSGIDKFQYGTCNRICPEAPVPVFKPTNLIENKGMAGNVYSNLIALGVDVDMLTNNEKPIKIRYVDETSNQMLIRVDQHDRITESIDEYSYLLKEKIEDANAVIISDYDKGFLSEEDIENIATLADDYGAPTFLDTKKKISDWARDISFIKINHREYLENEGNFDKFRNQLIVTLGKDGAIHYDNHLKTIDKYKLTTKAEVRDLSGAGDTFLAGLVVKFVETKDVSEAIKYANKCASWVVTQRGVVPVDVTKL